MSIVRSLRIVRKRVSVFWIVDAKFDGNGSCGVFKNVHLKGDGWRFDVMLIKGLICCQNWSSFAVNWRNSPYGYSRYWHYMWVERMTKKLIENSGFAFTLRWEQSTIGDFLKTEKFNYDVSWRSLIEPGELRSKCFRINWTVLIEFRVTELLGN